MQRLAAVVLRSTVEHHCVANSVNKTSEKCTSARRTAVQAAIISLACGWLTLAVLLPAVSLKGYQAITAPSLGASSSNARKRPRQTGGLAWRAPSTGDCAGSFILVPSHTATRHAYEGGTLACYATED